MALVRVLSLRGPVVGEAVVPPYSVPGVLRVPCEVIALKQSRLSKELGAEPCYAFTWEP